jgi:ubiquitin-protein ligase
MKQIAQMNVSDKHPGIYYHQEPTNIQKGSALMFGPQITQMDAEGEPIFSTDEIKHVPFPFERCIFSFEIQFPDTYPGIPPIYKFLNSAYHGSESFRFHPNLYEQNIGATSGKVCVGMLGTWGANEWKPTLTIEDTLNAVKNLLGMNPIHAEPSLQEMPVTDPRLISYNYSVFYHSVRLTASIFQSVLDKAVKPQLEPFIPVFKRRMLSDLTFLLKKVTAVTDDLLKEKKNPFVTTPDIHHRTSQSLDFFDLRQLVSIVLTRASASKNIQKASKERNISNNTPVIKSGTTANREASALLASGKATALISSAPEGAVSGNRAAREEAEAVAAGVAASMGAANNGEGNNGSVYAYSENGNQVEEEDVNTEGL